MYSVGMMNGCIEGALVYAMEIIGNPISCCIHLIGVHSHSLEQNLSSYCEPLLLSVRFVVYNFIQSENMCLTNGVHLDYHSFQNDSCLQKLLSLTIRRHRDHCMVFLLRVKPVAK